MQKSQQPDFLRYIRKWTQSKATFSYDHVRFLVIDDARTHAVVQRNVVFLNVKRTQLSHGRRDCCDSVWELLTIRRLVNRTRTLYSSHIVSWCSIYDMFLNLTLEVDPIAESLLRPPCGSFLATQVNYPREFEDGQSIGSNINRRVCITDMSVHQSMDIFGCSKKNGAWKGRI